MMAITIKSSIKVKAGGRPLAAGIADFWHGIKAGCCGASAFPPPRVQRHWFGASINAMLYPLL
jgi:hypothetical protein